jgi:hypothetical protein
VAKAAVSPVSTSTMTTTNAKSTDKTDKTARSSSYANKVVSRKALDAPAHQEGEIDWLYRGDTPSKSPSAGLHKPTWKPSSKPAEQSSLKKSAMRASPDTATTTTTATAAAVPKHGVAAPKAVVSTTAPGPVAEVPYRPKDNALKTGIVPHLRPEDVGTVDTLAAKPTTVTPAGAVTDAVTDAVAPAGSKTALAPVVEELTPPVRTVDAPNTLPIGDVASVEEGQTIEDVVAHTTITKVPTTPTTTATTATDSTGTTAGKKTTASPKAAAPMASSGLDATSTAPKTILVNGAQVVPTPLADLGMPHPRPGDQTVF